MEIVQILEELAYDSRDLPREAIESAVAKREQITPHLLKILSDSIDQIDMVIEQDNFQGHLYAMYLLAQFREVKAYPLILKLLSYPGDIPHIIAGDILTEDMSRILASVCNRRISPMQQIIENPVLNEYVRGACLTAIVILVGCRHLSRQEAIAYFATLFDQKLERTPSIVWGNLVACSYDLYPRELVSQILKAVDEGLVDRSFIPSSGIETILLNGEQEHLTTLFQRTELIDDAVTEMEKWITPV